MAASKRLTGRFANYTSLLMLKALHCIFMYTAEDMQMGLYIRDDGVNALADRLAGLTGQSKTQAVREAIELRLKALRTPETLCEHVAQLQARARAAGIVADGATDKALMDDLSGDL